MNLNSFKSPCKATCRLIALHGYCGKLPIDNMGRRQCYGLSGRTITASCCDMTCLLLRTCRIFLKFYCGVNVFNTWGQNVIEASKEGAWLSPMGEVFKFFTRRDDKYPLKSRLLNTTNGNEQTKTGIDVYNDPNVDFPLIVNRESQTDLYKVSACETEEGINLYFINKADEPIELQQVLPSNCKPIRIETLYAPDRLSRTYLDRSDLQYEEQAMKGKNVKLKPLSVNRIIIKSSR